METVLDPTLERMLRIRNDPWYFFEKCVFTLDEADKWNPIKPYPVEREYLKWIVQQIKDEPLVAIVKHRRMVITWTMCGMAVWTAMFREGRRVALQSKKEEDSDELVQRCKFIVEHIPEGAIPVVPEFQYKYTMLSFPEIGSIIKGYPQGAEQLRQFAFSRIFMDEIAFWPEGRASYTGAKPTLEGGGQLCAASTRFPGFFKDLIEDRLDE